MKKLLIVLFLMAIATQVNAQSEDWKEICKKVSELAETIMERRQNGAPMVEVMEAADGNSVVEELIIAAYDQPGYSGDKMRASEINDFRNDAYLECVKAARN